MKKLLLLILFCAVMLTGCGNNQFADVEVIKDRSNYTNFDSVDKYIENVTGYFVKPENAETASGTDAAANSVSYDKRIFVQIDVIAEKDEPSSEVNEQEAATRDKAVDELAKYFDENAISYALLGNSGNVADETTRTVFACITPKQFYAIDFMKEAKYSVNVEISKYWQGFKNFKSKSVPMWVITAVVVVIAIAIWKMKGGPAQTKKEPEMKSSISAHASSYSMNMDKFELKDKEK